MITLDPALLGALAHPCIGALIGYLASKIALRMLFRPLRPWHVFGIRVPMTPGVLPARRRDLAINIGELVGRQLLTSKDIGAALATEPLQEHLTRLAERKIHNLFACELVSLPELIPHRFRAYFLVGVKTLKYQVGEGVNRYLASREFEEKFTAVVADRLDELGRQEIEQLFGTEARREIYLHLEALLRSILFSDRAEARLAGILAENLRQAAARGATINDLVPLQVIDLIRPLVLSHADPLLQRLGTQLLEWLIGSYPEKKEEGTVAWLGKPEAREWMRRVLAESVDSFGRKRLDALLAEVDGQQLTGLCRECAGQIVAACRSEDTLTSLRALLHLGFEHLFDQGRQRVSDCALRFFPDQDGRQLRGAIGREGLALLRSGASERMIHAMVHTMIDALLARPLGRLNDIVPHGVRQGLIEYLVLTANRLLREEMPGVMGFFNLKRMVADKVDALSLLQLERLWLSIMAKRFKYINLFGALLGLFIGLVHLALTKLG
ncbi:MAG: DUF445 family protein [Proteobacteria bacterium]|nr:DUF445 family protein [Pseudomonadota bacterium]